MSRRTSKQQAKLTETDLLAKILSSSQVNVIGNYVLGKTLGEGSFGKVKLATHSLTGQEVAVKVVDKIHAAVVAREIETWRHLHHPNIAQLYEVLTTESKIYMFTEYCAGGEAFDFLCNVNRMDDQDPVTRKMFREIVEAVAYCHEKNFVHRDLKLENVLLTEDFTVKVIDFGFTRPYNERNLLDTYCGSVAYAAPEMITGKKYSGPRADIWSLGVILYTLLCGYLPFDDDNEAIVHQKINALDYELPDFLSEDSKSLISQILQINPTDRISVQDILSHPWFTAFPFVAVDDVSSPNFNTPEESQLCLDMVDLGLNVESILESVCGDACDASSALWYLLLKERRARRLKSASSTAASTGSTPALDDQGLLKKEEPLIGGVILPPFPNSLTRERSSSTGSKDSTLSVSAREDGSSECVGTREHDKRISIDRIEHPHHQLHHAHHLVNPLVPPSSNSRSRSSSSSDVSSQGSGSSTGVVERISSSNHSGNSLQMLVGTHHQIHSNPLPAIGSMGSTLSSAEGSTHIHINPPPPGQLIPKQLQPQFQQSPQQPPQAQRTTRPRTAPAQTMTTTYSRQSNNAHISVSTEQNSKTLQVESLLAEARRRRSMNLPHQTGLPFVPPPAASTGFVSSGTSGASNAVGSGIGGNPRRTSVGILAAASQCTSPNSSPLVGGDISVLNGMSVGGGGGSASSSGGGGASGGNRRGVMIQAMRGGGGISGSDGSAIPHIQLPDRSKSAGSGSSVGSRYGRRANNNNGLGDLGLSGVSGMSSSGSSATTSPKLARAQILEEEEVEDGDGASGTGASSFGNSSGRRKKNGDTPGSGGFVSHLMASFSGRSSSDSASPSSIGSRGSLQVSGVRSKSIVEEAETE
ncbi:kinase-like domain-containing protein [Obelidium mucronatum]|nr:kinase-like domain-containing protein [Obelidium mucronatum]